VVFCVRSAWAFEMYCAIVEINPLVLGLIPLDELISI